MAGYRKHPPEQQTPKSDGDDISIGDITDANAIAIGRDAQAIVNQFGPSDSEIQEIVKTTLTTFEGLELRWNGENPFIGLERFTQDESQYFYGREELIRELLSKLEHTSFLCLAGPSGSGKSSIADAGILYKVKNKRADIQNNGSDIARKVSELSKSDIASKENERRESLDLRITPSETSETNLRDLLNDSSNDERFIVIDQFEEIFTHYSSKEDKATQNNIIQLIVDAGGKSESSLKIILVVRTEFLASSLEYPALLRLLNKNGVEFIGAMDIHELIRAIVKPLQAVGATIQEALVIQIISEVIGQPGALPLMQFTLGKLFQKQIKDKVKGDLVSLTYDAYAALGGISSSLNDHAENIRKYRFAGEKNQIFEEIFPQLVRFGEHGQPDTRRVVPLIDLKPRNYSLEDFRQFIQELSSPDVRLLTTDDNKSVNAINENGLVPQLETVDIDTQTVTLAHEKLLDAWEWLRNLLNEQHVTIALQNQIFDDARLWEKNNRQLGFLYREGRLVNPREQFESDKLTLNALASDFLQQSITTEDARVQAEEAARQRALDQAHALAETQKRELEKEKALSRQQSKTLRWSRAAGVALAATAIALFVAWSLRGSVIKITKRALESEILAKNNAEEATRNAEEATNNAQITIAKDLTNKILNELSVDTRAAIALSPQGLPSKDREPAIPYVPEAEFALTQALIRVQERDYFELAERPLTSEHIDIYDSNTENTLIVGGDKVYLIEPQTALQPREITTTLTVIDGVKWGRAEQYAAYGRATLAPESYVIELWQEDEPSVRISVDEAIACAEWHPTKELIAICSGNQILYWSSPWTNQTAPAGPQLFNRSVSALWSPDGTHLAVQGDAWELLIWQAEDERIIVHEEHAHEDLITAMEWSPDGKVLITGAVEEQDPFEPEPLKIWHTSPKQEPQLLEICPEHGVVGIEFVDDERFNTWSQKGFLRQWNLDGEQIYPTFESVLCNNIPGAITIENIFHLPNESLLVARSDGTGEVRRSVSETSFVLAGHEKIISSAALSSDAKYLATGSQDGTIRIWDTETGKGISILRRHHESNFPGRADVLFVAWEENGRFIKSIGEDGTLRRWEVFDSNRYPICQYEDDNGLPICIEPGHTLPPITGNLRQVQWFKDGTQFGTMSTISRKEEEKIKRYWITQAWSIKPRVQDRNSTDIQPTYQFTISASTPISLTHLSSGEEIANALWLPSGDLLLSNEFGKVEIFDPESKSAITSLTGYTSNTTAVAALPGKIAIADENGVVRVWKNDFTLPTTLNNFSSNSGQASVPIHTLAWSESGNELLGSSNQAILWDVTTGQVIGQSPITHTHEIYAAMSPDTSNIAVAHGASISIWNRETGKIMSTPIDGENSLRGIKWLAGTIWPNQPLTVANDNEFPPNAKRDLLLAWGGDGTVQLWDWRAGAEIFRITEPYCDDSPDAISMSDINNTNSLLLSVGECQDTIRLWNMWHQRPEELLAVADSLRRPDQVK